MTKETFVERVESVLRSMCPERNINSVLHSKIVALGRRFEVRSLSSRDAATEIQVIFSPDVNHKIVEAIEKVLR